MRKLLTGSMAAHFPGSRTATAGPGSDSVVPSSREARATPSAGVEIAPAPSPPAAEPGVRGSFDAVMFDSPDGVATHVLIHNGVDAGYDNSEFPQNGNITIRGTTVTIGLRAQRKPR